MLKKNKPQPQDDYFKQKYQMKKAIAAALSFDIVTEIEIAQKVELIRNPDEITVIHITLIQRSSSIHVNKKCYKAETCLKFKILFQLLIRWFKEFELKARFIFADDHFFERHYYCCGLKVSCHIIFIDDTLKIPNGLQFSYKLIRFGPFPCQKLGLDEKMKSITTPTLAIGEYSLFEKNITLEYLNRKEKNPNCWITATTDD